jgi:hypothetical protein
MNYKKIENMILKICEMDMRILKELNENKELKEIFKKAIDYSEISKVYTFVKEA